LITLTTSFGCTATSQATFVVLESPYPHQLFPTFGSIGTVVTISGSGFVQVSEVGFGQTGDLPLAGRWKTPPVIPPGDFQTGNSTVVWRNQTTGESAIWVMQGTSFVRSEALPFVEDCWVIGGTADFNGDGATDLLWRNQDITGFDAVWTFAGLRPVAALPVTPEQTDRNWVISCTGDFDRDGQPDVVWRNKRTRQNVIWLLRNLSLVQSVALPAVPDQRWQIVGPR
jgi:hypothetical protein